MDGEPWSRGFRALRIVRKQTCPALRHSVAGYPAHRGMVFGVMSGYIARMQTTMLALAKESPMSPAFYLTRLSLTRLALPLLASLLPLAASAQTPDSKLLVDSHNHYRQELDLPPLTWSDELAASAQAWADELARSKSFKHSNTQHGENLWIGTAGAYTQKDMVDNWGSEKQYYVHETYPKVAPSGVVGHYTQIIWRTTSKVGCGIATFSGQEVLACQYDPPGNWVGQKPY